MSTACEVVHFYFIHVVFKHCSRCCRPNEDYCTLRLKTKAYDHVITYALSYGKIVLYC